MDASFTALLATFATVSSALVSSLVTIRLFGMGKAKEHESRLFEKRSECYPLLYKILSSFIKILEFGTLTEDGIDKTLTKNIIVEHMRHLEPWDSANSVLASDYTIDLLFAYRLKLYNLLEGTDDAFSKAFNTTDSYERRLLVEQAREIEAAIRWEIRTHHFPRNEWRSLQQERVRYKRGKKRTVHPEKRLR